MSSELYDEFGNYIGPDLDSDSDDSSEAESDNDNFEDDNRSERSDQEQNNNSMEVDSSIAPAADAIVLHEDKQFYQSASSVYGSDVHTATIDEDSQALEEPIIAPVETKTFVKDENSDLRPDTFSNKTQLTWNLRFLRNTRIL